MAGKAGRSGRPAGATEKRAYQVRLEIVEADAFDVLVQRRDAEATQAGATANASRVLRALVRKALIEEGLLPESGSGPLAEPSPPKGKAKRRH
jgi:hypothetical protein